MIRGHYVRREPATPDTMKPTDRLSGPRRAATTVLLLLATASVVPACVYRPDIQQGNLLQLDEVDQVKAGMTRSQVRYILGTPMVSDPFDPQRWDYVYTFQRGRRSELDRSHFVVYFEGDKVSRVEKLDVPEETETAKIVRKQREAQAAAEAAKGTAASPAAEPPKATQPPAGG
jgi:outer membrane protein assembly factor BamE